LTIASASSPRRSLSSLLGAANFGTITSAFDPRVLQFALKFVF
jgi:hypothetical protein